MEVFVLMHQKVVLITGANSGVGFATTRGLAKLGASVVMVSRDPFRGKAAWNEIADNTTGPEPTLLVADLSSQTEIRALAKEVRRRFARIDVLINNAGAVFARRELTVDGIEKTFAVNHLAPFLLTNLLLDLVAASPAGRVVNVASQTHASKIDFANLQSEKGHNFFAAYMRSKLANILFTYELARRLEGTGITANCLCPGPTKSRMGENMSGLSALMPRLLKRIPFLMKSIDIGARTSIYVASAPELARVSGRFFLDRRVRRTKPGTYDRDAAARLWSLSEKLVQLRDSSPGIGEASGRIVEAPRESYS
jgi:NAD(P)-dependent dehydrogenase (short-subunit alcohol dehydrogenase family)